MNDLKHYHSQQARIEELEKAVRNLRTNVSKWKKKYHDLRGVPPVRQTRTTKAAILVQAYIDGDRSLTFRQIAEMHHLSRETIKNISYKLKRGK